MYNFDVLINQHFTHYILRYVLQLNIPDLQWIDSFVDARGVGITINLKRSSTIHWEHIFQQMNRCQHDVLTKTISSITTIKALRHYYKDKGDISDLKKMIGKPNDICMVWIYENFLFKISLNCLPVNLKKMHYKSHLIDTKDGYHRIYVTTTERPYKYKKKILDSLPEQRLEKKKEEISQMLCNNNYTYGRHYYHFISDVHLWSEFVRKYPVLEFVSEVDPSIKNLCTSGSSNVKYNFREYMTERNGYHGFFDTVNREAVTISGLVTTKEQLTSHYRKWIDMCSQCHTTDSMLFVNPDIGYENPMTLDILKKRKDDPGIVYCYISDVVGAYWLIGIWMFMNNKNKDYLIWQSPCLSIERCVACQTI